MDMVVDVHTHLAGSPGAVCSGSPEEVRGWLEGYPEGLFSVGIHPWATEGKSAEELESQMAELDRVAEHERVVAIGECGLDSLRGAPLEVQERLFVMQLRVAERLGKPVILHVVRQQGRVLSVFRRERPSVPWIWHGYRGGLRKGLEVLASSPLHFLSFGLKSDAWTVAGIDGERLLLETDATEGNRVEIGAVAERVAAAREMSVGEVVAGVGRRLGMLLNKSGESGS